MPGSDRVWAVHNYFVSRAVEVEVEIDQVKCLIKTGPRLFQRRSKVEIVTSHGQVSLLLMTPVSR